MRPSAAAVSFDELGEGCYVLEQGDYIISVNANSHKVLDSRTYRQDSTVVYGEGNARNSDKAAAVRSRRRRSHRC